MFLQNTKWETKTGIQAEKKGWWPGFILRIQKAKHRSEGFPRTGYFIPAHVGTGAGQVWRVLPPAPWAHFWQIWHITLDT